MFQRKPPALHKYNINEHFTFEEEEKTNLSITGAIDGDREEMIMYLQKILRKYQKEPKLREEAVVKKNKKTKASKETKPLKAPLYKLIEEEQQTDEVKTDEEKTDKVFLHFDSLNNAKININEFVKDITEKTSVPIGRYYLKRTRVETKKELIVIIPKVYKYGDKYPHCIGLAEYAVSFSYYKLDASSVVEFLKKNLKDKEVTLHDIKEIMMLIGKRIEIEAKPPLKSWNRQVTERVLGIGGELQRDPLIHYDEPEENVNLKELPRFEFLKAGIHGMRIKQTYSQLPQEGGIVRNEQRVVHATSVESSKEIQAKYKFDPVEEQGYREATRKPIKEIKSLTKSVIQHEEKQQSYSSVGKHNIKKRPDNRARVDHYTEESYNTERRQIDDSKVESSTKEEITRDISQIHNRKNQVLNNTHSIDQSSKNVKATYHKLQESSVITRDPDTIQYNSSAMEKLVGPKEESEYIQNAVTQVIKKKNVKIAIASQEEQVMHEKPITTSVKEIISKREDTSESKTESNNFASQSKKAEELLEPTKPVVIFKPKNRSIEKSSEELIERAKESEKLSERSIEKPLDKPTGEAKNVPAETQEKKPKKTKMEYKQVKAQRDKKKPQESKERRKVINVDEQIHISEEKQQVASEENVIEYNESEDEISGDSKQGDENQEDKRQSDIEQEDTIQEDDISDKEVRVDEDSEQQIDEKKNVMQPVLAPETTQEIATSDNQKTSKKDRKKKYKYLDNTQKEIIQSIPNDIEEPEESDSNESRLSKKAKDKYEYKENYEESVKIEARKLEVRVFNEEEYEEIKMKSPKDQLETLREKEVKPDNKKAQEKPKVYASKLILKMNKNEKREEIKKAEENNKKVSKIIPRRDNVITDEEVFAEDMYKRMIEKLEREEQEKARLEEEERLKAEEARKANEVAQEQEEPKQELSEEELKELEIARKIDILLKRLSKDAELRNFLLQYSEEDLQKLLGLDAAVMSFFNEQNYPEFYMSKLKDSKFTPYVDLAEFTLKQRMSLNNGSALFAGSEIDWEVFRALYLKMKSLEANKLSRSNGIVRNNPLDDQEKIDPKEYSEEVLAGNTELFKNLKDDLMDKFKKTMLLKEQLNAVTNIINRHKQKETTVQNITLKKTQQQSTEMKLPEVAKKYRVNMSLIERRKNLSKLEILERKYRILNDEPI